jgi:hypothetical protein
MKRSENLPPGNGLMKAEASGTTALLLRERRVACHCSKGQKNGRCRTALIRSLYAAANCLVDQLRDGTLPIDAMK